MPPLAFPPGLTRRPLVLADAADVAALIVAEEIHDVGTSSVATADLLGFWKRPSFDLASSTVGVFGDGGRLVAFAELMDDASVEL